MPAPVYVAFNPSAHARRVVEQLGQEYRDAGSFEALLRPKLVEFWVTTHQLQQFEAEVTEHPQDFMTWLMAVIRDEAVALGEGFVVSWIGENEDFIRREWTVIYYEEPSLIFDRAARDERGIGATTHDLRFASLLCSRDSKYG